MKRILMSIAIVAFSITAAQAQENKDVQETSTVKKVTQKDVNVKTQVIKDTDTDVEVIEVEGTTKQDQDSKVITNNTKDSKVVADNVSVDAANQQRMMANKQQQEADLARKIADQKASEAMQAENARKAIMAQQQADLEARRAALMHRPDGMARLQKN